MDLERIKSKIITVRGQQVIIDSEVAELYGVETKRVNGAVKNNPDKFSEGYILHLTEDEFENLRSKISTAKLSKSRFISKTFTSKGIYMIPMILKSPPCYRDND